MKWPQAVSNIAFWLFMCFVVYSCSRAKADEPKDKSLYVPLCFETHKCEEQDRNILFIGTGRGLVGVEQNLYSFGYMRIIPLRKDKISIGVLGNGGDKSGLYGAQLLLGYPW